MQIAGARLLFSDIRAKKRQNLIFGEQTGGHPDRIAIRHSLQREVGYLTAHSVLHLLGYDHMEKLERVRMREKEELVMEQLGLPASSSYIVDDDMA